MLVQVEVLKKFSRITFIYFKTHILKILKYTSQQQFIALNI